VAMPVAPAVLRSERIALRPFQTGDAPLLFAAATESITTVGRWMPWCHPSYSERDSIDWVDRCQALWNSGEEYNFAIVDLHGRLLGAAGLNHFNRVHNLANLGYWVRQSWQRNGIAVGTVRLLAQFGFATIGLTRIEIIAAEDNIASRRVALKSGATFECLARNRLLVHDRPVTAAVYSLIPP